MKLIDQILTERGGDTRRSFTVVPGFGVYVQGVRAVLEYSEGKASLSLGEKKLTLCGFNLAVAEYFQGDIFITGDIKIAQIE